MKRMLCLILAIAFLIPMNALAADMDGFMPSAVDMDAVARGTSELGPPIDRTVGSAALGTDLFQMHKGIAHNFPRKPIVL